MSENLKYTYISSRTLTRKLLHVHVCAIEIERNKVTRSLFFSGLQFQIFMFLQKFSRYKYPYFKYSSMSTWNVYKDEGTGETPEEDMVTW